MAQGLTMQEAMRVMAHITASEDNRKAFETSPRQVLDSLGIDAETALNNCNKIHGGALASLDALREQHDAMLGRLLCAHLAQDIHNATISGGV